MVYRGHICHRATGSEGTVPHSGRAPQRIAGGLRFSNYAITLDIQLQCGGRSDEPCYNNLTMIIAIACPSAIFLAELAGILVGGYPSLDCHGLIVISLLNRYILKVQSPYLRILPLLALRSLLC